MIYKDLTIDEKDKLLKIPAYISLLAANTDGQMNEKEKKEAIQFTHMKTYSCDPLLASFYYDAEKVFLSNIETLDRQLPKGTKEREETIKMELEKMEPILAKLGEDYSSLIHESMKSYTKHVSKAHGNALVSFLIPFVNWD